MINQIMEWIGLVIGKPRMAFEKIKTCESFFPGVLLLIFFALFGSIYQHFVFSSGFEALYSDLPDETKVIFDFIFSSRMISFFSLFFIFIAHFFQTAFYLLWFQFFGFILHGRYLWNAFALAVFPSFIVQVVSLLILLLIGFQAWSIANNLLSFAGIAWSLYLVSLAISMETGLRKLKVFGIYILPWVIFFILLFVLIVWIIVGFASAIPFGEIF